MGYSKHSLLLKLDREEYQGWVFKAKEYQALYVVSGRDEFQAHKHLYSYNLRVYLTNGSGANHCVFTFANPKNDPTTHY